MPQIRVAACQINTVVGDLAGNVWRTLEALVEAEGAGAALAVGLTGCQITFTPKTFPLTITATSDKLSHSTTVNIIVQ